MNEESKPFSPRAINVIKFQAFTNFFDVGERVMFEWFVTKGKSFKFKEFHYSIREIGEETGIKKARLRKIIDRFLSLGIIISRLRAAHGNAFAVLHYQVNYEEINRLLSKIYQLPENGKLFTKKGHLIYENRQLLSYFSKLEAENRQHKGYIKEYTKEYKSSITEDFEEKGSDPVGENNFLPFSLKNILSKIINGEDQGLIVDPSVINEIEKTAREKKITEDGQTLNIAPNDTLKIEAWLAKKNKEKEKASAQKEKERRAAEAETLRQVEKIKSVKATINGAYQSRVQMHNDEVNRGKKAGQVKSVTRFGFGNRHNELLLELSKSYSDTEIQAAAIVFSDQILSENLEVRRPMDYFLSKKDGDFDAFLFFYDEYVVKYGSKPKKQKEPATNDW